MLRFTLFIMMAFTISSCGSTKVLDETKPAVTAHEKNEKKFHDKMLKAGNNPKNGRSSTGGGRFPDYK